MASTKGIEQWGTLGNHDDGNAYLATGFFKNTNWDYSFIKGNIGFVCANTETHDIAKAEQLITELESNPGIKWILVIMHKPIWIAEGGSVSSDTKMEFHEMFKKHPKVRIVFAGHNHFYARMKPIDNILYCTIGHGGRNSSSGTATPATFSKINGAYRCSATADGSITCANYANADDGGGAVLDQWTMSADGTLPTDGAGVNGRDTSQGDGNNEGEDTSASASYAMAMTAVAKAYGTSTHPDIAGYTTGPVSYRYRKRKLPRRLR